MKRDFFALLITLCVVAGVNASAKGDARTSGAAFTSDTTIQQPLYSEYKGIRLDMTMQETRAKLGSPAMKSNDQDYYVFSDNETAQIGYNAEHKVVSISVDYLGGVGAPDYKAIVGGQLGVTPAGSLYRMVVYESLGFWVSYNRTTGIVPMVSITIQKTIR